MSTISVVLIVVAIVGLVVVAMAVQLNKCPRVIELLLQPAFTL